MLSYHIYLMNIMRRVVAQLVDFGLGMEGLLFRDSLPEDLLCFILEKDILSAA